MKLRGADRGCGRRAVSLVELLVVLTLLAAVAAVVWAAGALDGRADERAAEESAASIERELDAAARSGRTTQAEVLPELTLPPAASVTGGIVEVPSPAGGHVGCVEPSTVAGERGSVSVAAVDAGCASVAADSYEAAVLDDDPVALWTFAADGPQAFADEVGGVTFTEVGGAVPIGEGPGALAAAELDGATALRSGSEDPVGGASELTVAGWVRFDEDPAGDEAVLLRSTDEADSDQRFSLAAMSLSEMRGLVETTGSDAWTASVDRTVALEVGQWHHLAMVYDGAEVRYFVDGEQAGSAYTNVDGDVQAAGDVFLMAGARWDSGSPTDELTGALAGLALFDTALPQSRLADHVAAVPDP